MNAPGRPDPGQEIRCSVIELRQYTLHPGQRDVLIELFDREFVETQEAVGISVIGQFRDQGDPDRFVWVRGFPDMRARAEALTAFYVEGDAWRRHRDAAVATMVDSDDVLLLRPVGAAPGLPPGSARPSAGAGEPPASRVMVTIYHREPPIAPADPRQPVDDDFAVFFRDRVAPVMTETGARPLACFQTEPAENTYPALPVRTGENVFVWFAAFPDAADHAEHGRLLDRSRTWTEEVLPELSARLICPPRHLTLTPTARSRLR
ncbi:NIPSNAP family protein [Actinomadura sp. HBU206391]|uniref:NIPSNAP family protein n=1 Tax=Actinomadura sp. HBU206391 TaxID=2731692 RepID=UPI00164FE174|nr:NIPSNAP family protein [Actinomadura sp. HBU206391]MBC6460558.1 NIPSNAP family protein [Actinomadura sp. HBU206391]